MKLKKNETKCPGSALDPLHTYYSIQFSVAMGFLSVRTNGFLIPVLSLGLFSLGWFVLLNFNVKVVVFSY